MSRAEQAQTSLFLSALAACIGFNNCAFILTQPQVPGGKQREWSL